MAPRLMNARMFMSRITNRVYLCFASGGDAIAWNCNLIIVHHDRNLKVS